MEDEGVLAANGPHQLRHPRREAAAGVVVRPRDVRLVAPLIVPSVPDPFPNITRRGQKPKFRLRFPKSARRRAEQHRRRPRAYLTSMMATRGLPRAIDTSFAADTYDTLSAIPARLPPHRASSAAAVLFRRRIRKDWSSNTLLVPFVFFSGEDS